MRTGYLTATAAIPLAAACIAACGSSTGNNTVGSTALKTGSGPVGPTAPAPKTASGQAATIGLEHDANLGSVLVDSRGRTLYLFEKDSDGKSVCAAACATAWPPLRAAGRPVSAKGLTQSKVGLTTRPDGKPQVTYNGHPLYRYAGDIKPGDTNGQGLNAFGAAWFAVSGGGNVVSR